VFLVLVALVAVWWFFDHVKLGIALCLAWIQQLGVFYGSIVLALVIIVQALLLLPCLPFTLGAGFLYGCFYGSIVVHVASTIAAFIGFVTSRYLARELLERKLNSSSKDSTWRLIDRAIRDDGFRLVFLIRFSPLHPYGLCNYLFGMTSVTLKDYMLGSFFGMIPATVIEVYFGTALKSLADLSTGGGKGSSHDSDPASKYIFWGGLIVTLLVTVYMTLWVKRKLASRLSGYERVDRMTETDDTSQLEETDFETEIPEGKGSRISSNGQLSDAEREGLSAPTRKYSGASRPSRHVRKTRVYQGESPEQLELDHDIDDDDDGNETGVFVQSYDALSATQNKGLYRLMQSALNEPAKTTASESQQQSRGTGSGTNVSVGPVQSTPLSVPAKPVVHLPDMTLNTEGLVPSSSSLILNSPSLGELSIESGNSESSPVASFSSTSANSSTIHQMTNTSTPPPAVPTLSSSASMIKIPSSLQPHSMSTSTLAHDHESVIDRYRGASPFSSASLMGWSDNQDPVTHLVDPHEHDHESYINTTQHDTTQSFHTTEGTNALPPTHSQQETHEELLHLAASAFPAPNTQREMALGEEL